MRSSKYDAATLAPLVASSHSLSDVIRKLGLSTNGGNHRHIGMRIRVAGLDTSHFRYGRAASRMDAIPAETLRDLVQRSTSVAQVLAGLGLPTVGGSHRELSHRLRRDNFDMSHFLGHGWSRGQTKGTHPSVAQLARSNTRPDDEVFIENSPHSGGPKLVKRLLALGWSYACRECGISEWLGKPLTLHLDHLNGVHNDNRFSNLRLLCPNCHSQTPTYCNKAREDELIGAAWPCYRKHDASVAKLAIRADLRSLWRNPWGFDSPRSHEHRRPEPGVVAS